MSDPDDKNNTEQGFIMLFIVGILKLFGVSDETLKKWFNGQSKDDR